MFLFLVPVLFLAILAMIIIKMRKKDPPIENDEMD